MNKKKISVSTLINIVLGVTLVIVLTFGYFYWRGFSPVEVVKSTVTTVVVPEYEYQFAIYGGKKDFNSPYEVLAFNNSIYVSDFNNSRIVVFDRNGKLKKEITSKEFANPAGMFWDGQKLWVADSNNGKIIAMNSEGVIQDKIKLAKGAIPADVAIDNGIVYWLNSRTMLVEKYDLTTKKTIKTFGGYGNGDGQLYYPYDLTVKDGKVYVTDSLNNRINVYNVDGKFITAWAKKEGGQKGGGLAVPRGIAFDNAGRLFTVEGVGHRVTALNADGEVILNITKTETIGKEVQDMNLPTDVAFDEVGRLYVLEHAFKRVLVYKLK